MSTTRSPAELTPVQRRSELAGTETRLLELAGTGPPLLLLHGFADSADTWRPTIAALGERGRAATAIDLAGFGEAAPPRPGDLLPQWDAMVGEAVEAVSAGHQGREVVVAGNSLGGCLAMRAGEDPELPIAGVVPIAPAGLHMARWFPVIESQRLIRLLAASPLPVPEAVVRELVGRVYASLAFADRSAVDPMAVASFTRHIPTVRRGNEILALGRRLLPELANPFRLDRINCPLLLIWGEEDRMVYTTGAEQVLRTVPYADIEILPRCGHCPQVEAPEQLADLLTEFPAEHLVGSRPGR